MSISLLIASIFFVQLLCFFVAWRTSRYQTGEQSYFLASKQLKFFPLLMTFVASLIGGGSTLGAAEEAYNHGYIIFLYPIGGALGFLLIAYYFGDKWRSLNVKTLAGVFEDCYQSPLLKKIASLFSMIALFSILMGQMIATRKFLLSLGISSDLVLIGFWSIVFVYTILGGLKAVAMSDVVQGLFFIIVFGLSIFMWQGQIRFDVVGTLFLKADYDINKYGAWLLMPMLFMLIEQDVAQRCLGAANSKSLKKAAFLAAIISLAISSIPICIGINAKEANLSLPLGSSVLICAMGEFMPSALATLAASAVIAAIVSTADSQINAIASNVSCDFFKNLKMKSLRIITVLISIAAIFSSYLFDNVIDVMMFSLEMYVSGFLVPLMAAIFARSHNKTAAYLSIIFGLAMFAFMKFIAVVLLPHVVLSLLASLAGYLIGVKLLKKSRIS